MSGFGGAFAAAMVGLVFVVAISSLTSLSGSSLMLLSQQADNIKETKSAILIISGELQPGRDSALVNMTLVSTSSQNRVSDFKYIDIIVTYRYNSMVFSERLSWPDGWSVNRVFVSDVEGEILNPLRESCGLWDAGENLEILLRTTHPIDPSSVWSIVVAMPDGGVGAMSFGG
ncbi:MAG: hypothetical protein H5T33_02870 [Candidatus Methanosuratus sp.]|nr:hypothetical protein [Candidatus Methanosuratincola sp.]